MSRVGIQHQQSAAVCLAQDLPDTYHQSLSSHPPISRGMNLDVVWHLQLLVDPWRDLAIPFLEDDHCWELCPICCNKQGYSEPPFFRSCCLSPDLTTTFLAIGPLRQHIKSQHGLIHIHDAVEGIVVLSPQQQYSTPIIEERSRKSPGTFWLMEVDLRVDMP